MNGNAQMSLWTKYSAPPKKVEFVSLSRLERSSFPGVEIFFIRIAM